MPSEILINTQLVQLKRCDRTVKTILEKYKISDDFWEIWYDGKSLALSGDGISTIFLKKLDTGLWLIMCDGDDFRKLYKFVEE